MKAPPGVTFTEYAVGTVLWHGTSYPSGFRGLQGPMWVSNSHAVASWFSTWRYTEGDEGVPRVHKYEVIAPFRVPTFNIRDPMGEILDNWPEDYTKFQAWTAHLIDGLGAYDPSDFADIEWLALTFCKKDYEGWRLIQNYTTGDDIMICKPERHLRRVHAGTWWRPRE